MDILKIGILKRLLIKFKSKRRYFFTKNFRKTYTSKNEFNNKYNSIVDQLNVLEDTKKIIIINIASSSEDLVKRNFGLDKNVIDYNSIILEVSRNYKKAAIIDLYEISKNNSQIMLSDGIHINKNGHDFLAERIYNCIIDN